MSTTLETLCEHGNSPRNVPLLSLKFPAPYNNFIFDAMVDRVWDIAQTRYGARCMRTCLERKETSHFHKVSLRRTCKAPAVLTFCVTQKRIATAIILHAVPLATNPNGALLLTWLMDAPELPGRFGLLASRLASHFAHLATHKLACLTILRSTYNSRNDRGRS